MFVYICLGYYEWIDFKNSRENKPKKGEEEKEAIQEGMNEYEEKH